MKGAQAALMPAAQEIAGAASGMLAVGPTSHHVDHLAVALIRGR